MATERWDATLALADRIEAGGFDARTWLSGDHRISRVYVSRSEYLGRKGRKVTDCGFVELRDAIDFSHLTRQAGTIEGLCVGVAFAATPEPARPVAARGPHEDALDPLEAEALKGPGVEHERFG